MTDNYDKEIKRLEEQLSNDVCVNKVLVMRESYVPHDLERCKTCEYYYSAYVCHDYRPLREKK